MSAARLRHTVALETQTRTRTPDGDYTITWETQATVRAAVEDLGGSEYWQAGQFNEQINSRVVLRHLAGINLNHTWRIRDVNTGELFDVQSVISPDQRYGLNRYIEVKVRRADNNDR